MKRRMGRCVMFAALCIMFTLGGCATGHSTGTQPPPSPLEAQLIAESIFGLSLYAAKLDVDTLVNLHAVLTNGKAVMRLGLAQNPQGFEATSSAFLKGVDPVFQQMIRNLMQIFILRLRPYIDQEGDEAILVNAYVQAVLNGAMNTTRLFINRDDGSVSVPLDVEGDSVMQPAS